MIQKSFSQLLLAATFAALSVVFGVLSAIHVPPLPDSAPSAEAKRFPERNEGETQYPIRAFIHDDSQEQHSNEESFSNDAREDSCTDVSEIAVLTLSTSMDESDDGNVQRAYERIEQRARMEIIIDEGTLTAIEQEMGLALLCPSGCRKQAGSARCERTSLQNLEECMREHNHLTCTVQYTCSVTCVTEESTPVVLRQERRRWWENIWK